MMLSMHILSGNHCYKALRKTNAALSSAKFMIYSYSFGVIIKIFLKLCGFYLHWFLMLLLDVVQTRIVIP